MPRPTPDRIAKHREGASKNPFASWLASMEDRRMAARHEAEKMVTNEAVKNQMTICNKLLSVDFSKSKLPASVLEQKTIAENQRFCDLEECAIDLAITLRNDTQIIKVDSKKLDQKLLTLVLLFQEAVEQGNTNAAYMAQSGIRKAINDIRPQMPQVNPQLLRLFIEVCANYLEIWVNLVIMARDVDRNRIRLIEKQEEKKNASAELEKLCRELQEMRWTTLGPVKLKGLASNVKRKKMVVEISDYQLQQMETQQAMDEDATNRIRDELLEIKEVNPNKLEQFREDVRRMETKMARIRAEYEERFEILYGIEDIIRGLNEAEGNVKLQEHAIQQAELMLEQIYAMQDKYKSEMKAIEAQLSEIRSEACDASHDPVR